MSEPALFLVSLVLLQDVSITLSNAVILLAFADGRSIDCTNACSSSDESFEDAHNPDFKESTGGSIGRSAWISSS